MLSIFVFLISNINLLKLHLLYISTVSASYYNMGQNLHDSASETAGEHRVLQNKNNSKFIWDFWNKGLLTSKNKRRLNSIRHSLESNNSSGK